MFPNNAYAEHHKTVQMLKMNTGTRPPMMNAQGIMNGDPNNPMASMQMHQQMMNNQFQSPTTMMGGISNSPNQAGTPGNQASTPKAAETTPTNPPPSSGLSRGSTPANLSFNNIFPSHNSEANTNVSTANPSTPMTSAPGSQPPSSSLPLAQTTTSNANGTSSQQNNSGPSFQMNQFERYVNDGEFIFDFGMDGSTGNIGAEATGNGAGSNVSASAAGGAGLHPADDLSGSLESIMGMDPFSHSEYF
ncbi:hypothetical protein DSO57_1025294 [Entomophthora muscae]|uniref:Uncharacterized protein n=1 Tax=Entomophthora muscae TaxID=34485 RepID=A0ACC2RH18_9FUNG|nr:hypothetical protein DSO57_1025294 [Entomophthora muscae]